MPVEHSYPSPFAVQDLDSYVFNVELHWSLERSTINLVVRRYADKTSFQAGKAPVQTIPFEIGGAAYLVHMTANQDVYERLASAIDAFLLTLDEFKGGRVVA